jgi:photosystem II stability/assembly factor-like uncharacterized protein
VPWLNQQPTKPSSRPPLAAPCRAGDLRAHLFLQGATGSLVGEVDLFNAGPSACSLLGRPTVSFTGAAAAAVQVKTRAAPPEQPEVLADPPGSLRAFQPGKSARVALFWSNWCGAHPDALTLGLASGTTIHRPFAHAPRCDAPQYPSTISVGRFTPAPRHLPMSSRLPLRVAIVGSRPVQVKPGLRAFRLHRGERFDYEVAVTNTGTRPFRFAASSCPSYIEQFGNAPAQVYVLNCRPVGTIAPRQTVLFQMQLMVPATARAGNNSLTWQLAPRTYEAPFTAAAAWVATPAHIALRWLQMIDEARGYALSGQNTDSYRLLWTTDGGRRWRDVTPGRGTIHPSGPLSIVGQTRLFSTKLKRGVFAVERSHDGGRTWRRSLPVRDARGQGAGQPFALDARHLFLAVDEGAAAGSQGEALYTSNDGGYRWQLVSRTSTSIPARGSLPFGCDKSGFGFATPKRGWAGGYCAGGLPFFYRTADGGRTWRRQSLPAPSQCACETSAPRFFTPRVAGLYVTGFTTNGGGRPFARVLWTNDAGDSWRGSDPSVGRAVDVSFADARNVWITGQRKGDLRAPFNLLLRTDDAGAHWQTIRLPFDAGGYRLDALSATAAYGFRIADRANVIVFTRDGGRTWHTIHAAMNAG